MDILGSSKGVLKWSDYEIIAGMERYTDSYIELWKCVCKWLHERYGYPYKHKDGSKTASQHAYKMIDIYFSIKEQRSK